MRVRHSCAPDFRFFLIACDVRIGDDEAGTALLDFLSTTLQPYIHEERVQTASMEIYGGFTGGFEMHELAKKLLELTVVRGPAWAATTFMRSLTEPECEFQVYTLLGGVKLESPVEPYDGVRLIILPQTDTELPGYLPYMFEHGQLERFRGAALLVEEASVSPRYMNPEDYLAVANTMDDSPFRLAHKSTEVPNFSASDFCKALSMVVRTRVFPSVAWRAMSDDEVARPWSTGSGYSWMLDPDPRRRTSATTQQIQEAKNLYESLTSLSPDVRTRLSVPIDRLIESWGGKGHVDQIIDLAIALESLYLPEYDSEMSYRLRNRGARFLEADLTERRTLAGQLKTFYGARSKAVHTGKIPDRHKVGDRRVKTAELIGMTQELCLRSIRQVIDGGFPDWETVELS